MPLGDVPEYRVKVTVPVGMPEVPLTFAPSVADVPVTAGVVLSVAVWNAMQNGSAVLVADE